MTKYMHGLQARGVIRESGEGWMGSLPTFSEIWDIVLFSMSLVCVLVMGPQLPGDWAHHNGESLPGTATVTQLEGSRGGQDILVDVRSATGDLVARGSDVNGDAPDHVGVTFAVSYLPTDDGGTTQVYVAGHDPFATNVAVFTPILLAWLISLPFIGARLRRLVKRARGRRRSPSRTHYVAGQGYISE